MEGRRSNLVLIWLVALLISVLIPVGSYFIGKAGDCQPGQIDGQCGLSTFVSILYGLSSGAVILISITVYVLIAAYRRRQLERRTEEGLHEPD
jgi:cation transporter-like permease